MSQLRLKMYCDRAATPNADYHSILIFFDNKFLADFFDRHASLTNSPANTAAQLPFLLFEKDEFLVNFTGSLNSMLVSDKPVQ